MVDAGPLFEADERSSLHALDSLIRRQRILAELSEAITRDDVISISKYSPFSKHMLGQTGALLFQAVRGGHALAVVALLDAGVDIEPNSFSQHPLHCAIEGDHKQVNLISSWLYGTIS